MSDSIQLLSPEDARKPYWDQYFKLTQARNQTMSVLRALGVVEFPDEPKEIQREAITAEPQPALLARSLGFDDMSLSDLVRKAADVLQSNLSRATILRQLQIICPGRDFNPDSVGVIVGNVARDDGWKLVEKGIGGKPSVYKIGHDKGA